MPEEKQRQRALSEKIVRRRARIADMVAAAGSRTLDTDEIARALDISPATARRDLAELQRSGKISRTYGGAIHRSPQTIFSGAQEPPAHMAERAAIASLALPYLEGAGMAIFDAGVTVEQVARAMNNRFEITVVTNGIRSINALAVQDKVRIHVLGGFLQTDTDTISGTDAELVMGSIQADVALIGATQISERGIGSRTYEQARLKTLMMMSANEVVVLADSSKLHDAPHPYWSPFPSDWSFITDGAADREYVASLPAKKVQIAG